MTTILFRLISLAVVLLIAGSVGSFFIEGTFGPMFAVILVTLIIYAFHARSGLRILRWLDDFKLDNVPRVSGWWDDLAAKLFHYLRLHQRQQQALSGALVSFRKAAQALPDGVITLDSMGHILWCNETAQSHLALKLTSDTGQRLVNLVRNPDFANYLQSESWEQPLVMRSLRHSTKILSIQVVRYGDQQMLVLTRDVTQVEKLERMRRDFIANVSHELKTPLTVLSGFLETFRDLPLTPEQRKDYLDLMHTQARRMENLVEDLLTLSALESGSHQTDNEQVDLSGLAQKTADEALRLSNTRHTISIEIEPHLFARGNLASLHSAFSNIVSNAVRYTPEKGQIHIQLEKSQNTAGKPCAKFTVRDTGIGISPEHLPRLTERFYRVDRSRSRESGGTGLGLAIVKHAVSRHEGELQIESRPHHGSVFVIFIPLEKESEKAPD